MLALSLLAQMHRGWDAGDGGWWRWVFGPLMMLAVVALIAWAVVAATRAARTGPAAPTGPVARTPRDILAERYARGEIDTDEYQERLRNLS